MHDLASGYYLMTDRYFLTGLIMQVNVRCSKEDCIDVILNAVFVYTGRDVRFLLRDAGNSNWCIAC